MRHLRFEARTVFPVLGVTLVLVALAATAIPTASQPKVTPKGKMVLARHPGLGSRWLNPQEHEGTTLLPTRMAASAILSISIENAQTSVPPAGRACSLPQTPPR